MSKGFHDSALPALLRTAHFSRVCFHSLCAALSGRHLPTVIAASWGLQRCSGLFTSVSSTTLKPEPPGWWGCLFGTCPLLELHFHELWLVDLGDQKRSKGLFPFSKSPRTSLPLFHFPSGLQTYLLNIELSSNITFTGALFLSSSYTFWGWGAWVFVLFCPVCSLSL